MPLCQTRFAFAVHIVCATRFWRMEWGRVAKWTGRVCQLNYDGGGILEHHINGFPRHIPFFKPFVLLRVGQEVSFRTEAVADLVEAVDIRVQCHSDRPVSADRKVTGCETLTPMRSNQKSCGDSQMSSTLSPSQTQRFQHQVMRFQNAQRAEQLQQIIKAERLLSTLLRESQPDGDAFCRLVRKCASWLRPPVRQAGSCQMESTQCSEVPAGDEQDQLRLQWRVRKILLGALNHLDLQDPCTFHAVQTAIFYVISLLQQFDKKHASTFNSKIERTCSLKQWLRLRQLIVESGVGITLRRDESKGWNADHFDHLHDKNFLCQDSSAELHSNHSDAHVPAVVAQPELLKRSSKRSVKGYQKAFSGTAYGPSAKTQALPTVSQDAEFPVQLQCSECPFTITSSWWFQHPKTLIKSLLTPRDGHNLCQRVLKKRCYWRSLDGSPVMAAISSNMEFCTSHQRLLTQCAPCGGKKMCIHARQKYHCHKCRGNGFCVHGRRKSTCRDCWSEGEQENKNDNCTRSQMLARTFMEEVCHWIFFAYSSFLDVPSIRCALSVCYARGKTPVVDCKIFVQFISRSLMFLSEARIISGFTLSSDPSTRP